MRTGDALRVLFVDDEPRLLDGLRRAMYRYRDRCDVTFAIGGAEALAHLRTRPADVVVTDMRMPDMDGAMLLGEIARDHPQIIRVVLSGQIEAGSAQRAMRVAHQFLVKPVAASGLARLIDRLATVRSLIGDESLRRRAGAVSVLPASPALHDEVVRLCRDPAASIREFAETIERDPAMTAKLLQLAGSAFFGRPVQATGVAEVVGHLRLETLRAIVGDGGLATSGCDDPALTREVVAQQRHALLVAGIARRIVPDRRLADDAFAAGLLHDVGKLLLLGRSDDASMHAGVGAYLLGIWGLPDELVAAVAVHHAPAGVSGLNSLAEVTRAADALARACDGSGEPSADALGATCLGLNRLAETRAAWLAVAAEEYAALGSARQ